MVTAESGLSATSLLLSGLMKKQLRNILRYKEKRTAGKQSLYWNDATGGSPWRFTYRFHEGFSWIDALYFTSTTITTVGFGDLAPTSPTSRLFTTIYALVSIPTMLFCLGLVIEGFLKRRIDTIEDEVEKVIAAEDEILKREEKILAEEKKIEKVKGK